MSNLRKIRHAKLLIYDIRVCCTTQYRLFRYQTVQFEKVSVVGTITSLEKTPFSKDNLLFLIFVIDDGTGCIPCVLGIDKSPRTVPFGAKDFDPKKFAEEAKTSDNVKEMLKMSISIMEENSKRLDAESVEIWDDIRVLGRIQDEKDIRYILVEKVERFANYKERMIADDEILQFYDTFSKG